jgi:hypothetical protein
MDKSSSHLKYIHIKIQRKVKSSTEGCNVVRLVVMVIAYLNTDYPNADDSYVNQLVRIKVNQLPASIILAIRGKWFSVKTST